MAQRSQPGFLGQVLGQVLVLNEAARQQANEVRIGEKKFLIH